MNRSLVVKWKRVIVLFLFVSLIPILGTNTLSPTLQANADFVVYEVGENGTARDPAVSVTDEGYEYDTSYGLFTFSGTTPLSYSVTPEKVGSAILYSAVWLNASMVDGEHQNFPYVGSSTIITSTNNLFDSTTEVCGDEACETIIGNLEVTWRFYSGWTPPKLSIVLTKEDLWDGVIEVVSPALEFSSDGWGGWSCPSGYSVVGGGYEPTGASVLNSLAWEPGASVGEYSYPATPFGYTYGVGEEGWIVQAGEGTPLPTNIVVLCSSSHDYGSFHLFWIHSVTSYAKWVVEAECGNGEIAVTTPLAPVLEQTEVVAVDNDVNTHIVDDVDYPSLCTRLDWTDYGVATTVLAGEFTNPILTGKNLIVDFGVNVLTVDPSIALVVTTPSIPQGGSMWYPTSTTSPLPISEITLAAVTFPSKPPSITDVQDWVSKNPFATLLIVVALILLAKRKR